MHRKVLIAGGSGMIGRKISQKLLNLGDQVGWLTRSVKPNGQGIKTFLWDPDKAKIDSEAIHWATHIINLAGESIGETHWTKEGKQKILSSRINAVKTLHLGLTQRSEPLTSFVGVSGVGIYGPGRTPKNESDTLGNDFPAEVAKAWETSYGELKHSFTEKKTILRLAVVLSAKGGALPQIMMPVKFGFGAALGSGKQPFNWIHLDDAANAFVQALEWDGIYNVAAPDTITNYEATKQIAKALHRPFFLPNVPEFLLKLALGDRSTLVTKGNVADIQKLLKTGFLFRFPGFQEAINDLVFTKG